MNKCQLRGWCKKHGYFMNTGKTPDLPVGTRVAIIMRGEVANIHNLSPDILTFAAPFKDWDWKNTGAGWDIAGYKVVPNEEV